MISSAKKWSTHLIGWLSLFVMMVGLISSPALAVTNIQLLNLAYQDCPADMGQGTVTSGGPTMTLANCFIVTGQAENTSGRMVLDADVFGRIYDANNNPIMENRNRLGSIPEIPPGISTFELRITVPEGLAFPLKLEKFKASGFTSKVR